MATVIISTICEMKKYILNVIIAELELWWSGVQFPTMEQAICNILLQKLTRIRILLFWKNHFSIFPIFLALYPGHINMLMHVFILQMWLKTGLENKMWHYLIGFILPGFKYNGKYGDGLLVIWYNNLTRYMHKGNKYNNAIIAAIFSP